VYSLRLCELIESTCGELKAAGVAHGQLNAATDTRGDGQQIVVATIDTLPRRKLDTPDWLIFDECHLSKAKSWVTLRARFPHARLLGFIRPDTLVGRVARRNFTSRPSRNGT
jgi:hypothetical protein